MKKKKKDLFWPVMIVLSIFSFGISYFVFYQITSKVETKSIKTSKSVVIKDSSESQSPDRTIVIGDGQGASASPTPNTAVTPEVSGEPTPTPSATPKVTPSGSPTVAPLATATPLQSLKPITNTTPSPSKLVQVVSPTPTPAKKTVTYKVRVGSFDSKADADKKAKDLEALGYDAIVVDEPEGSYIQIGAFKENDRAVSLAEEVSQKGFSVGIRQVED